MTRLSEFADTTDIAFAFDDPRELDDEGPVDSETGAAYGLDEVKWFDASAGIVTFGALQLAFSEGQPRRLTDEERARIL